MSNHNPVNWSCFLVTESEDALAALRIAMEDGRQTASPAGSTVDIEGAGENGLPDVTDDAVRYLKYL